MANDYIARAKNRARYLFAGQSHVHRAPYYSGQKPDALGSLRDLDYMDRNNPLFTYDMALYSPGSSVGVGNERLAQGVFTRRPGNLILTDSGGLQYARDTRGTKWRGAVSQEWSLRFAEENGDESIALDIPTVAIGMNPQFPTYQACLDQTLDNARYWVANRRGNTRFLAVLQGRDSAEALDWLAAAKTVPMEGWSFGGAMRTDYQHLVRVLLDLRASGLLGRERNRVHVLGKSSLTHAVMLSAIQRSMRKLLEDEAFLITFDTASPSIIALNGLAYGHPSLSKRSFAMTAIRPPSHHDNADDATPFPVRSSALACRLTVGDFIDPSPHRQNGTSNIGNTMLAHHNIEALLSGIDQANSVMELPGGWKDDLAPQPVIAAYDALATFWQYPRNPLQHLARSKAAFGGLKSSVTKVQYGDGEYSA